MDAGRRNDDVMADPSQGSKPLRVLLSEGSSTSAREAITVLGLATGFAGKNTGARAGQP
jgi:hypothetical protein